MLQGKRQGKVNKWGLSEAHEAYCQRRAQGAAPADAYLDTVATKPDMDKYHAAIHASKLERLEKIQARLQVLQEQAEAQALMTTATIQAKLTEIATDETQPVAAQLKALDQLAKIQGAYNEKIEVRAQITMDEKEAAARRMLEVSLGLLLPAADATDADEAGEDSSGEDESGEEDV